MTRHDGRVKCSACGQHRHDADTTTYECDGCHRTEKTYPRSWFTLNDNEGYADSEERHLCPECVRKVCGR